MSTYFDRNRVRYLVVLSAIVALTLVTGWYVTNSPYGSRWLFALPLGAMVLAGIEWDRIVQHGMTV